MKDGMPTWDDLRRLREISNNPDLCTSENIIDCVKNFDDSILLKISFIIVPTIYGNARINVAHNISDNPKDVKYGITIRFQQNEEKDYRPYNSFNRVIRQDIARYLANAVCDIIRKNPEEDL